MVKGLSFNPCVIGIVIVYFYYLFFELEPHSRVYRVQSLHQALTKLLAGLGVHMGCQRLNLIQGKIPIHCTITPDPCGYILVVVVPSPSVLWARASVQAPGRSLDSESRASCQSHDLLL